MKKLRISLHAATLIVPLTCTLILAGGLDVTTPIKSSGDGPIFVVDYTNLQGTNGRTYVEFYVQVGFSQLQFIRTDDGFGASYQVALQIRDAEGEAIESETLTDRVEVPNYELTQALDKARNAQLSFALEPGGYNLHVVLTDLETEHATTVSTPITVRDFSSASLSISDIQLSHKIRQASDGEPYTKNNRYVEPNALRTFAHGAYDIFVYFEVYNLYHRVGRPNSTYTARFIIHDQSGNLVGRFTRQHQKPSASVAHSLKLPVDFFKTGTSMLTIEIRDDRTGAKVGSSKSFTVLERDLLQSL